MNDRQVADILNYVRNSWGNVAETVEEAEVSRLRTFLKANGKIETPHVE